MANIIIFFIAFAAILQLCASADPKATVLLSENNTTVWRNNDGLSNIVRLNDGSHARFIILRKVESARFIKYGHAFGFGFHCQHETNTSCSLAVLFLDIINNAFPGTYQEVWSANPSNPVGKNATLELASDGDLILNDAEGKGVWKSNTHGQVLSHIDITMTGNTRLFNQDNEIVWQSFEHPTDTLRVGQRLRISQQLKSAHGVFNLKIRFNQIRAYAPGHRPVNYFSFAPTQIPEHLYHNASLVSIRLVLGSLNFLYNTSEGYQEYSFQIPITTSQFFRVDQDGGMRIYGWEPNRGWKVIYVFGWDECAFPLKCGRYGFCQGGQCTCPVVTDGTAYFKPINPRRPNLGCEQHVFPPAKSSAPSELIHFEGLSYSTYCSDDDAAVPGIEQDEDCKQVCAMNSTCKAALFKPLEGNGAKGTCFLITDVFTIRTIEETGPKQQLYLKIQTDVHKPHYRKHLSTIIVIATILAVVFGLSSLLVLLKKPGRKISDSLNIPRLTETPLRFSHNDLRVATKNFSKAIGEGGFGVVFEGTLKNGMMVAVKKLKKASQGMEEFLAEMETLGTIHHINLVNLIGFCADKKGSRMLVYEHMKGGSLDQWIFHRKTDSCLNWNIKKKILFDIAKGLAYLHHECRQKIAHLDVKPQNILLNENFDAKLSDFGTSKLINRDESEVITHVRGTLGYLAPEWQQGNITVKADTYSFGAVILEVVTSRKILDFSKTPEYLLSLFQRKATENRLMDIVDQYCGELALQSDREEVVKIVQLGMWCLNINYTKRPAMSLVVKVLEGFATSAPNYNLPSIIISPSNILNCLLSDAQA